MFKDVLADARKTQVAANSVYAWVHACNVCTHVCVCACLPVYGTVCMHVTCYVVYIHMCDHFYASTCIYMRMREQRERESTCASVSLFAAKGLLDGLLRTIQKLNPVSLALETNFRRQQFGHSVPNIKSI